MGLLGCGSVGKSLNIWSAFFQYQWSEYSGRNVCMCNAML